MADRGSFYASACAAASSALSTSTDLSAASSSSGRSVAPAEPLLGGTASGNWKAVEQRRTAFKRSELTGKCSRHLEAAGKPPPSGSRSAASSRSISSSRRPSSPVTSDASSALSCAEIRWSTSRVDQCVDIENGYSTRVQSSALELRGGHCERQQKAVKHTRGKAVRCSESSKDGGETHARKSQGKAATSSTQEEEKAATSSKGTCCFRLVTRSISACASVRRALSPSRSRSSSPTSSHSAATGCSTTTQERND